MKLPITNRNISCLWLLFHSSGTQPLTCNSDQIICLVSFLRLYIAAVGSGWLLLESPWNGQTALFCLLKVAHFVNFVQQSTLFITSTKCTILINENIKGTSPKCFGTSVPFSGRTKCQQEAVVTGKLLEIMVCTETCQRCVFNVCIN